VGGLLAWISKPFINKENGLVKCAEHANPILKSKHLDCPQNSLKILKFILV
jgi:hypothetical protein